MSASAAIVRCRRKSIRYMFMKVQSALKKELASLRDTVSIRHDNYLGARAEESATKLIGTSI